MDMIPLGRREAHLWERDPHDFCSERLFEAERFEGDVLDPACGIGRICLAGRQAGLVMLGTDLVVRASGFGQADFLKWRPEQPVENIVSNPPFGIAERFVRHALLVARRKVAMLLPSKWVQGDKRSRWLETTPLKRVLFLTPAAVHAARCSDRGRHRAWQRHGRLCVVCLGTRLSRPANSRLASTGGLRRCPTWA
jgi:hypothetical protein